MASVGRSFREEAAGENDLPVAGAGGLGFLAAQVAYLMNLVMFSGSFRGACFLNVR
jgi:hypothetical protein